ncbi:Conidiation-specific protein 10 [Beauveria bassiana]|nr:Conidiation-specific protein 10 [Beauveria bassiana]
MLRLNTNIQRYNGNLLWNTDVRVVYEFAKRLVVLPVILYTTSKSFIMADNNPGNFANRPKEEVQEIASKGGKASGGGQTSGSGADSNVNSNTKTGNQGFASMDPNKQREIASKGGKSS